MGLFNKDEKSQAKGQKRPSPARKKKQEPRKKRVNRDAEKAVKRANSLLWLAIVAISILVIGSLNDLIFGQKVGDAAKNGVKQEIKTTGSEVSEAYMLIDRLTSGLNVKEPAGTVGNGVVMGYRAEFGKKDREGDLVKVLVLVDKAGWLDLEEDEQKQLAQNAGSGANDIADYVGLQKTGASYISLTILDNKSGEQLAKSQVGKLKKQ
ncbi:hypothetical protein ACTFR8_23040 [Bacillus cereus group sp. MYBK15-3]|uniref:hypothetical protein n=1 Tax=unclassified Bacillus cereus group TaxID=2750818 RepID=UPI003F7AC3DA